MNIQTRFYGHQAEVSFRIPTFLYYILRVLAVAANLLFWLAAVWLFAVLVFSLEG